MTRSRLLWLLPVLVGLVLWLGTEATAGSGMSSSFSKASDGWYGLRRGLEVAERPVRTLKRPWSRTPPSSQDDLGPSPADGTQADRSPADKSPADRSPADRSKADGGPERFDPWSEVRPGDVLLVTAFPWQRSATVGEQAGIESFLRDGGVLILAYSGSRVGSLGGAWESAVLEVLGLSSWETLRPEAPWSPMDWWRYRQERWTLTPELGLPGRPELEVAALDSAPAAPADAHILYRRPPLKSDVDGDPTAPESLGPALIFTYERLGGRVLVLPAPLWSNAELLRSGNLALVPWAVAELGGEGREIWLDEYHHGVVAADLVASEVDRLPWDFFFLHLGLMYALGLWALARRFGPVWQERPAHVGSTASFLENLGGFHHRLHHHRTAASRMRSRLLDLDPGLDESSLPTEAEAEAVSDGADLVRFAHRIAQAQRRGRS